MCDRCNNSYCFGNPCTYNGYGRPYTIPSPFNKMVCGPNIPPAPNPCQPCGPCNDNGCLQRITTNCVFTVNPYSCIGTAAGDPLTTVLAAIDAKLCSPAPPTCQVKITADDECCDYLGAKIISDNLVISTVTDSGTQCQTLKINAPAGPDLSCLGKVVVNTGATCRYLIDALAPGAVAPQLNGSGTAQTISFVQNTATFQCQVATGSNTLPVSSDTNGNVVCSNTYYNTNKYPAPTAVGVPIVGKSSAWALIGQTPSSGPPIVTLGNLTFAGDQGVTGTYACTFTLPAGTYDIALSYAITNGNSSVGATGMALFVLQDQSNPTDYIFPCKEVVSCAAEQRISSSFYVAGVVIPSGGITLLLRCQNSIAVLAGSTHDNLTLAFKKVG